MRRLPHPCSLHGQGPCFSHKTQTSSSDCNQGQIVLLIHVLLSLADRAPDTILAVFGCAKRLTFALQGRSLTHT